MAKNKVRKKVQAIKKAQGSQSRSKVGTEDDETLLDLVEARESAQGFIEKNQFLVLGLVGAFILLVGGFLAYKYMYQEPRNKAAMSAMYKAEQQFKQDSFALALENPGGGFEGFLDIVENYGGTKAANLSKYYAGVSYLNIGDYESAVEYLKSFSASGQVLPITKFGALGDAYSELQDFESAISSYSKAVNGESNNFLTPYYLKKLAMLHEKQGDADKAKGLYERIKSDFPESEEGQVIDKYISKFAGS